MLRTSHSVTSYYGKHLFRFSSPRIWPRRPCVSLLNTLGLLHLWKCSSHHPHLPVFNLVHTFLTFYPLMSEAGEQHLLDTVFLKSCDQEDQRQSVIFDPLPQFLPRWNVLRQFSIYPSQVCHVKCKQDNIKALAQVLNIKFLRIVCCLANVTWHRLADGSYSIDADPECFMVIINFLQVGSSLETWHSMLICCKFILIQWHFSVWSGDTAIDGWPNHWGHWLCCQSIGPGFRNKPAGKRLNFVLLPKNHLPFSFLAETSWRESCWGEAATLDTTKATRLIEICCWIFSNKCSHIWSERKQCEFKKVRQRIGIHFCKAYRTPIHLLWQFDCLAAIQLRLLLTAVSIKAGLLYFEQLEFFPLLEDEAIIVRPHNDGFPTELTTGHFAASWHRQNVSWMRYN